jgi:hypothetical protein
LEVEERIKPEKEKANLMAGIQEKEQEAYAVLWKEADTDGSGGVDAKEAFSFFTERGGMSAEETMELVDKVRSHQFATTLRQAEFEMGLGLLCLRQQGGAMEVEAVRNRQEALIPRIAGLDPFAQMAREKSGAKLATPAGRKTQGVGDKRGEGPMEEWTVEEVCAHFRLLNASEEHLKTIVEEGVDGEVLAEMELEELKTELELPFGVRTKHKKWLAGESEKGGRAQGAPDGGKRLPLKEYLVERLGEAEAERCMTLLRGQGVEDREDFALLATRREDFWGALQHEFDGRLQ